MSTIHTGATLTPGKVELVTSWIGLQRWYAGHGHEPRLSRMRGFRLDDPTGEVGIETLILRDDAAAAPTTYQVPLTYRGAPLAGAEAALVGTLEHSVLGTRWVYDAPFDPVYVQQLYAFMQNRVLAQASGESDTPEWHFTGYGSGDPAVSVSRSRVLSGEQSNTSVICDLLDRSGEPAAPAIVKVFRVLSAGDNPDIILQQALAQVGCRSVPASVGYVDGSWGEDANGAPLHGQLAFAQEFLAGTTDAWRVALTALATGADFADRAAALGATTAQVHTDLARALPTRPATPADQDRLRRSWQDRHTAAVTEVPALAAHEDAIRRVLDRGATGAWPTLQRVHGDYHLGQVLDVPGRGWVLLDFEGEPLRPLTERSQPDLALRDVAGMRRSFDYAAAAHLAAHPGADPEAAHAWALACRAAFLRGYGGVSSVAARFGDLLAALELDKALYEVVYEARHRPTWLGIPRSAIDRLTSEA